MDTSLVLFREPWLVRWVMFAFGLMEQLFVSSSDVADDTTDAEGGEERMHSMVSSLLNDMVGLSMTGTTNAR